MLAVLKISVLSSLMAWAPGILLTGGSLIDLTAISRVIVLLVVRMLVIAKLIVRVDVLGFSLKFSYVILRKADCHVAGSAKPNRISTPVELL